MSYKFTLIDAHKSNQIKECNQINDSLSDSTLGKAK